MIYLAVAADACTQTSAHEAWSMALGIPLMLLGFAAIIWAINR